MRTPRLKAWQHANGSQLVVWCQHCGAYHFHGHGEGHRVAHCTVETSPYRETGYDLVNVGPMPAEVLRDIRRRRPQGPAEYLVGVLAGRVQ